MFKPARDIRYQRFLRQLHGRNLFDWYLEIGCRTGKSLAPVRGNAIAVDPFFRVETNVIGGKPSTVFFQNTSDAFFASRYLEKNEIQLSFSFLDGMHLFEYLLRDFVNTERHTAKGGAIALHDCCPSTTEMTTRNHEEITKGAWTGDVWKLIPILKEFRPELTIDVLGCRPTGLVIVSNISRSNTVLSENYRDIVAKYQEVEFSAEVVEEFYGSFDYEPASTFLERASEKFRNVCVPEETVETPAYVSP